MKKKSIVLTVIGIVLIAIAVVAFFLGDPVSAVNGAQNLFSAPEVLVKVPELLTGMFANFQAMMPMSIIVVAVVGVFALLWLIHLIVLIARKSPSSLFLNIFFLIATAVLGAMMLIILTPSAAGGIWAHDQGQPFGLISEGIWFLQNTTIEGNSNPLGYGRVRSAFVFAFGVLVPLTLVIGFFLMFLAVLFDFAGMGEKKKKAAKKKPAAAAAEVAEEAAAVEEVEEEEEEDDGRYCPQPQALPMGGPAGIVGPLLVQYINTYSPNPVGGAEPEPRKNSVPVTEIAGAIAGETPLTAEDVRKIIQEELSTKEEAPAQPVIVSVPAPAVEETPSLSAEDVRKIFEEELAKAQPDEGDVIVEEEPVPGISADDVRAIIAEALAEKPAPVEEAEEPVEEVDVRAIIREELAAFYGEKNAAEEARRAAEEEEAAKKAAEEEAAKKAAEEEAAKKAAEEEAAKKAAEEEAAKKAAEEEPVLTAEDIRRIIAEALAAEKKAEKPAEPAPQPEGLTAEDIRDIIREELAHAEPDVLVIEDEGPVVVEAVEEEPAPAPAPAPAPEPAPAPAPAPAPTVTVVVQAPEPKPAPAPEAEKAAIERIPFPTRLLDSDEEVQTNYNILKSEILSYGVKSRVSNTGDTFRLHKVTYVKITVAGKGLKLYFALDPKAYADSKIPVSDAGHKGIYRDIPLVFKVKSDLSLRRAKQLIADVMAKFGNEKGEVEDRDWAYALKDYKVTGDDEE